MSDRFLEEQIDIKLCMRLSLEVKRGAFSMIPKANDKVCNGNSRHLHDPTKLMSKAHMRTILITFFDIKGIVHFKFIRQGQAVNEAYVEIMKRLPEAIHRRKPEHWPRVGFFTMT
jgi:hypothetical protein